MSQRWLNGAVYFTALLAGSWALRAAAPFPDIPQVRQKLDAFSAEKRCEVLFLGSSKIYSGIIPRKFDSALKQQGVHVRSFNLGVDGMGFPESAYLCEEALRRRPNMVRWIFVEAAGIRTAIPATQRQTRRLVYWHDLPRTFTVAEAIFADARKRKSGQSSPRELLLDHGNACLQRMSNLGEGTGWIRKTMSEPEPPGRRDTFDLKQRGYTPIAGHMPPEDWGAFKASLGSSRESRSAQLARVNHEALLSFANQNARSGATVIYLFPPNPRSHEPLFQGTADMPTVFSFDDPKKYPELFERENRSDSAHLNDRGAEIFTRLLADRFAEHLNGGTVP